MTFRSGRIAILGGGFQGACLALELAGRGVSVDLYERNPACLAEAAENNEGKIHLGFVYANDPSFATARLMAEGARAFEPLLARWLGTEIEKVPVSTPFLYAVHRDSLLSPAAFEVHARRVAEHLGQMADFSTCFGRDPARAPERLSDAERSDVFRTDAVIAAFRTEEIAIDPVALAGLMRTRLAGEPRVNSLTERTVDRVRPIDDRIRVHFTHHGEQHAEIYDDVVNTTWSSRLQIDTDFGLAPPLPWSHRLKYFLRAQATMANPPPSTTFVLGPFGDVVDYGNGLYFLSWYPASLAEWSDSMAAPHRPAQLVNGAGDGIRDGVLAGLGALMRGLAGIDTDGIEVRGNWIFAWGDTDIDDPASLLHQRRQIGVRTKGRYMTIDTGKLTMAPYYAERAADLICR